MDLVALSSLQLFCCILLQLASSRVSGKYVHIQINAWSRLVKMKACQFCSRCCKLWRRPPAPSLHRCPPTASRVHQWRQRRWHLDPSFGGNLRFLDRSEIWDRRTKLPFCLLCIHTKYQISIAGLFHHAVREAYLLMVLALVKRCHHYCVQTPFK